MAVAVASFTTTISLPCALIAIHCDFLHAKKNVIQQEIAQHVSVKLKK